jgi:hypothetical protein
MGYPADHPTPEVTPILGRSKEPIERQHRMASNGCGLPAALLVCVYRLQADVYRKEVTDIRGRCGSCFPYHLEQGCDRGVVEAGIKDGDRPGEVELVDSEET